MTAPLSATLARSTTTASSRLTPSARSAGTTTRSPTSGRPRAPALMTTAEPPLRIRTHRPPRSASTSTRTSGAGDRPRIASGSNG
jgi:hypothetical protein